MVAEARAWRRRARLVPVEAAACWHRTGPFLVAVAIRHGGRKILVVPRARLQPQAAAQARAKGPGPSHVAPANTPTRSSSPRHSSSSFTPRAGCSGQTRSSQGTGTSHAFPRAAPDWAPACSRAHALHTDFCNHVGTFLDCPYYCKCKVDMSAKCW